MVGAPRFELGTSCAQGRRATRLRYAPTVSALFILEYFPTLLQIHITVSNATAPPPFLLVGSQSRVSGKATAPAKVWEAWAAATFPLPGKEFLYKGVDRTGNQLSSIPYKLLDLNRGSLLTFVMNSLQKECNNLSLVTTAL
jgi:hypothetical protein